MARVTVDDCLAYVDNAFELVLKASERAREIQLGEAEPLVSLDNDKPTVLALREIAMGDAFVEALKRQREAAVALDEKGLADFEEAVVSERELHAEKMAEEQRKTQKDAEIEHYFDAFNQHTEQLDKDAAEKVTESGDAAATAEKSAIDKADAAVATSEEKPVAVVAATAEEKPAAEAENHDKNHGADAETGEK